MRRRLLPLLASALALLAPPPGPAEADPAAYQSQIQRGLQHLERAQSAHIRGELARQKAEATQAEQRFIEASRIRDRDPTAYRLGCMAASFRVLPNRAQSWYVQYRDRSSYGERDPELPYLRAFILVFAANQPGGAVKALIQMRAIDPRHEPVRRDTLLYAARVQHGAQLGDRRSFTAAAREYREAARLARHRGWKRKAQAALGSAAIAFRLDSQWKEAMAALHALIAEDGENPLWHWNLGLALANQNRFQDAVPRYEKVIALRKMGREAPRVARELDTVHLRLGNCLRHLANATRELDKRAALFARARASLEAYIALHPKDGRGHRWLGTLHYPDLDDPHAALPHLRKAHALDPDCEAALLSIVQILHRHEPPAGSDEAARKAWTEELASRRKDLEEGKERRAKAIKERGDRATDGDPGCD